MILEKHIQIDQQHRGAVAILGNAAKLPGSRIKDAMQKGAVWLTRGKTTQRLRRARRELRAGDELHLYYNDFILDQIPPEPELIAEQGDFSLWFKPFGLYSQGSRWGDHCTINRWIETHLQPQRPSFIVHRLDRAASGIMVIAHSKSSARMLADQFAQRKVEKHYQAIVHGKFPSTADGLVIDEPLDEKTAWTRAIRLEFDPKSRCSLLDVEIKTGRKHQIRRHLSEKGYPLVGDRLYGDEDDEKNLQLISISLRLAASPGGEQRTFRIPDNYLPRFPSPLI